VQQKSVILPQTDAASALVVAEHIRAKVKDLKICFNPERLEGLPNSVVTISLGIASVVPGQENDAATLLQSCLIGINYEQLQQLVKQAEVFHSQKQEEMEAKKVRLNKKGAGCKNKLSIADQIILTLVYLAQNSNFEYLGIQFEVSESAAHNIFRYW